MKTLVDYLLYEAKQNFLIKGHTKKQMAPKIITDRDINVLNKGFSTFYKDIKISIDYNCKKDWDNFEYKEDMLNNVLDLISSLDKPQKIGHLVWAVSKDNKYHVRVYNNSGKLAPICWLEYDKGTICLSVPRMKISHDRKVIIDMMNDLI